MSASSRPGDSAGVRQWLRAYRSAALRFGRAFARGNVDAIEDAFSQMQELERAFERGEISSSLQPLRKPKDHA
jgi:hypothetical protein